MYASSNTSLTFSSVAIADSDNGIQLVNKGDPGVSVDTRDADSQQVPSPTAEPPDGGLRAWLLVLGCWCTSFCSFGWINSIGVFQEYYESVLLKQYSTSTVAWIPSLQIFFMMGSGPIIGALYDRFGPRHLIFVGTILHVFGIMMASISTQYYQILLSQGVCSAIGVAAVFQPALNTIAGWFSTNSGAAFGILATGSSLGGVIFPIMLSRLVKSVGFGWSMRISAFLMLGLLIIANLTVKTFQPPKRRVYTLEQLYAPFKQVQFVALAIGLLLFTFGVYPPINYIAVEAAATGMDPNLVQYMVPILNAGSLFGRGFSGFVSDKVGRYNVFIVVCSLAGISILALWIPAASTAARIVFAALFGFFSGAYLALIAALVMQISPADELGLRAGIIFFSCSIGGLNTSPISGAILAKSTGWLGPKLFAGILCLAGTSFVLVARINQTGWKLMAKC